MPRALKNRRSVVFHLKIDKTAKKKLRYRKFIGGNFADLAAVSIAPGAELGKARHKNTDEILFVVKGRGKVTLNHRTQKVGRHDAIFVAAGQDHKLKNVGWRDLKLVCIRSPLSTAVTAGIHKCNHKAQEEEQFRHAWEQ